MSKTETEVYKEGSLVAERGLCDASTELAEKDSIDQIVRTYECLRRSENDLKKALTPLYTGGCKELVEEGYVGFMSPICLYLATEPARKEIGDGESPLSTGDRPPSEFKVEQRIGLGVYTGDGLLHVFFYDDGGGVRTVKQRVDLAELIKQETSFSNYLDSDLYGNLFSMPQNLDTEGPSMIYSGIFVPVGNRLSKTSPVRCIANNPVYSDGEAETAIDLIVKSLPIADRVESQTSSVWRRRIVLDTLREKINPVSS